LHLDAVPFTNANDFVPTFDHIKYLGVTATDFEIPSHGSIMVSADIKAFTPLAIPGLEMRASDLITGDPVSYEMLQGRQAAVTLHMVNLLTSDPATETGQLFDWFVSGDRAFCLYERLFWPPGSPIVDKAYTQIVHEIELEPGKSHNFAMRYNRNPGESKDKIEWLVDGKVVARVKQVGIPLDHQKKSGKSNKKSHKNQMITDPSDPAGGGELLKGKLKNFAFAHGLFSLLDVWPYGQGPTSEGFNGVSIPPGNPGEGIKSDADGGQYVDTRIWGQGAEGYVDNYTITIVNRGK
jgi:hypothetical protein